MKTFSPGERVLCSEFGKGTVKWPSSRNVVWVVLDEDPHCYASFALDDVQKLLGLPAGEYMACEPSRPPRIDIGWGVSDAV